MVGGDASADAVDRARALPGLGVGLHVVLVEGRPVLPPEQVPDLVDEAGSFRTDMVRAGIDIFVRPTVRRQLAAEVEAQFAAFAATGLRLDHVNAHKHFHLHPTIAATILRVGARYGLGAVRAPVEPAGVLARIEPGRRRGFDVAKGWARLVRRRMRRAGLVVPDQVFGLAWSGALDGGRLLGLLHHLPDGLTEIYCHPATSDDYPAHASGYGYRAELAALTDARVAGATSGIRLGCFADFAASGGAA